MKIISTGVNLNPEDVIRQYKVLKKIKSTLVFDLIHYPYWIIVISGVMNGFLVKDRPVLEMLVIDGRTETIKKLVHYPEIKEVDVENAGMVINNHLNEDRARGMAESEIWKVWERTKFHPLRPVLTGTIKKMESKSLYKPYWILHNGVDTSPEKLMVVDATTGGSNLPETNSVIQEWVAKKVNPKR